MTQKAIRKSPIHLGDTITQVIIMVYLFIGLVVFVIVPFLAGNWLRTPFIGAFVEHGMVFNNSGPIEARANWPARIVGIQSPDRLLAVDGEMVANAQQLNAVLRKHITGETVVLNVEKGNGKIEDFSIKLVVFSNAEKLFFYYIPVFIGLIYLATGLVMFVLRRKQEYGRALTVFCVSIGLVAAGLLDLYTTQVFTIIWLFALVLAGASIFDLVILFPSIDPIYEKRQWLRAIHPGIAAILLAYVLSLLVSTNQESAFIQRRNIIYIYDGVMLIIAMGWFFIRRVRMSSTGQQDQIRQILFAALGSYGPIGIWLVVSPFYPIRFSPYLLLPFVIFPIATAYVVLRFRIMRTDVVMSRALLYSIMAILSAGGYALIVGGLGLALSSIIPVGSTLITGFAIFFLAIVISPMRQGLENAINSVFFRGSQVFQEKLQAFTRELTSVVEFRGIISILRNTIDSTLTPSNFHIYIYDLFSEQYLATPGREGRLTSDVRFSINSPLVQVLSGSQNPLVLPSLENLPNVLHPEHVRLGLLGASVFIPLPGQQRLAGWMALGQRLSGEPYSSRELSFLEALADQASLAIERAQVVVRMENRVREMNVLARVAQGINITLSMDDILELIYAQTIQVIPADDFHLMLSEQSTGSLIEIFYVEKSERLQDFENRPVMGGKVLEQEIIRVRRSIITDDYNQECQRHGIPPSKAGLFAWMCVPLNAGAETIGAISLAKRDTYTTYTTDQLSLLQAIADQAAGAIVKARLLQETERRAKQLSMLNEVNKQLTSTLEVEPLLQNIVDNASVILNCEAGSLLLVDEQTDELVFRVTCGPVAEDLINKRMAPGTGFVGKAVQTRKPIIVNDVQASRDWFAKNDQQTGFVTHGILAVPLEVQDKAIGVIEVINKKDATAFNLDDQQLLLAFAAQAAVAIDNARLYTLTDQALANRVEELSVMQRIDRELNTSLDTTRAMEITLDWAMRQSKYTAGFIGAIQESGIQVISAVGYQDELDTFKDRIIPLELGFTEVLQNGQPSQRVIKDGQHAFLKNATRQAIIPIRRETGAIGVLTLENSSGEGLNADVLNFMVRLSDHAVIAISNAQLYAAVQSANLAKSEFVSFVSHELKNPMTSIKGYTELLASGAVGQVNEAQANFLGTIRSNVERMATLVTDLADVSRIEAGRLKLDFKPFTLNEVVEEITKSLKRQFEEKSQQLVIEIPVELPQVWADRNRINQIITNLVSNANKYTPANGQVVLGAEVTNNQWDEKGAPKVVHLWVKDSGIGINQEDQKKIFQKFFRSEDPKTREAPGTGLGLNITKSLVEMQGGTIWFESEFRMGTTFHFTIPAAG